MTKMMLSRIILICIIATGICAAFSLLALNQNYKIAYLWYSEEKASFVNEVRVPRNSAQAQAKDDLIGFEEYYPENADADETMFRTNENRYFRLWIKKPWSVGDRLRVVDIVQRGDVVEWILDITTSGTGTPDYKPASKMISEDKICVSSYAFSVRGKLHFVIKNAAGDLLKEQTVWANN